MVEKPSNVKVASVQISPICMDPMPTFDTEIGRFGGLICWENYMPLARMVMYSKGIEYDLKLKFLKNN